ncbi:Prostamide prostaglandin F synthase [Brachionus plicatilis]|uniref:Prostamide prostaglandin F synthase n=1 Tax=Brachionus plicatilis TaxID=10195 RepID=A0A3M7Q4N2_BRAPC|nr:Prostamide prostaglandin F synthase [Brachionus plicatilis]
MTGVDLKIPLLEENFSKLQTVLDEARQDFSNDVESFCKTGIFKMGRFIRFYADLMKQMNTKLNEDFVEELDNVDFELNLEEKEGNSEKMRKFLMEWNDFLKEIESKETVNLSQSFQVEDLLPENIKNEFYLSQIVKDKPEQFDKSCVKDLHLDFRKKQDSVSNKSFVIFGEPKGAYRWFMENHVSFSDQQFDMVSDQDRRLYKLFGLPNSYVKVWNSETLIYYAEQLVRLGTLPGSYQDVEDDPHQMGGNFILQYSDDSNFRLIFSYKSKNPPDRPSAQTLLEFLESKF